MNMSINIVNVHIEAWELFSPFRRENLPVNSARCDPVRMIKQIYTKKIEGKEFKKIKVISIICIFYKICNFFNNETREATGVHVYFLESNHQPSTLRHPITRPPRQLNSMKRKLISSFTIRVHLIWVSSSWRAFTFLK